MLNIEELAIIRMYQEQSMGRQAIMDTLKTVIPFFSAEEEVMKSMTQSALRKLTAMTDQSFAALDFSETVTAADYDVE